MGCIMNKELEYFKIGDSYGGNQNWFSDYMMKMGGCAAVTACDCSIYFSLYFGKNNMYPFSCDNISKKDYIEFSEIMKPYLRPRMNGIDTLDIFMNGYFDYMKDVGESNLSMKPLYGEESYDKAKNVVIQQIENKYPIPCLILHHKNHDFEEYVWHWFLLIGDKEYDENIMVKAVTYGNYEWLDLKELWDTGYEKKGGLILFD